MFLSYLFCIHWRQVFACTSMSTISFFMLTHYVLVSDW